MLKRFFLMVMAVGLIFVSQFGTSEAARYMTDETVSSGTRVVKEIATDEVVGTVAAKGSRIKSVGDHSGEDVIASFAIVENQMIYAIDRTNGLLKKFKANNDEDYLTILADKADEGMILVMEGVYPKTGLQKASSQIEKLVEQKKEGTLKNLQPMALTDLSKEEIDVLEEYLGDPANVSAFVVTERYVDNRVKDTRSDLEKGLQMLNDATSAWYSIKSICQNNW